MPPRPQRIVLPGGSGDVGRLLARHFHERGDHVTALSRRPTTEPWSVLPWDGHTPGPWMESLHGADAVINLAGRTVDCRYTAANRREIHDSRTLSTALLHQVIASLPDPPRVWLNASTATIYRHALDRPMDEATGELGGNEPGAPDTWNFSIAVARDWEAALFAGSLPRTRRVALRSAMIFSPDPGSVFAVLSRLVRLGLGGAQGRGSQFVSWIHGVDFVRAVDLLLADLRFEGPVNLAAPNPLPNRDFMRALRRAWRQSLALPTPTPLLAIGAFLLRTETELVLKSRRVVPGRLLDAGFRFHFPLWPAAADDLVRRWRAAAPVSATEERDPSR